MAHVSWLFSGTILSFAEATLRAEWQICLEHACACYALTAHSQSTLYKPSFIVEHCADDCRYSFSDCLTDQLAIRRRFAVSSERLT